MLEVITDWGSVIEAVLASECDIRVCIWHYKIRTQIRENKLLILLMMCMYNPRRFLKGAIIWNYYKKKHL